MQEKTGCTFEKLHITDLLFKSHISIHHIFILGESYFDHVPT